MRADIATDLERLGVPLLDLLDGGHVAEVVGQLIELLDPVCEAHGEFLCLPHGLWHSRSRFRESTPHLQGTGWL